MKAIEFPNVGIIESDLSEEQIDYLNECIANKGEPFKNNLVGNIHNSFKLYDKNNWFFKNALIPSIMQYQDSFFNLGSLVPTTSFHNYILYSWWVNYQKKHDFNPIHDHNGIYSFVIWMKIPTDYREQQNIGIAKGINSGGSVASDFQFQYNNILGQSWSYIYHMDKEVEGKMILFPSSLKHCVYPFFECDKTRVSISGNIHLHSLTIP
tara:strand:- start:260 stop:886 length:627 start_codon:yes stop_codon:yes gene_type:complete